MLNISAEPARTVWSASLNLKQNTRPILTAPHPVTDYMSTVTFNTPSLTVVWKLRIYCFELGNHPASFYLDAVSIAPFFTQIQQPQTTCTWHELLQCFDYPSLQIQLWIQMFWLEGTKGFRGFRSLFLDISFSTKIYFNHLSKRVENVFIDYKTISKWQTYYIVLSSPEKL